MGNIIHIGANKTGSTTLQRCLFSKSDDLIYLGEDCNGYEHYKSLLDSLVSDDDIHFCWDDTRKLFDMFTSLCGTKTFIYSNEDIMTSRVPALCAKRLCRLLPDAQILLVIRNQLTAISSWYANHGAYLKMVPRRYWRRYVSFDDWMQYCVEFMKYSPLESFLYHRILSMYKDVFGEGKIHVLFFEDFVENQLLFINKLSNILNLNPDVAKKFLMGKHERPRNTMRQIKYNQFRSFFLYNIPLSEYIPFGRTFKQIVNDFIALGKPANIHISEHWENILIELYGEDNKKLSDEYSLPLAEYGYPIQL